MLMKLDKNQDENFDFVAQYIYDNFMEEAQEVSGLVSVKPITVILSTLRKRLNDLDQSKGRAARIDNRQRQWKYNFAVYLTTQGNVGAEMYRQSEVVTVTGLNAVISDLRKYLTGIHRRANFEPERWPTTSKAFLKKRFGGMRPAVSRYGGKATTSIPYVVDNDHYMVYVRLTYAELELDKDLTKRTY